MISETERHGEGARVLTNDDDRLGLKQWRTVKMAFRFRRPAYKDGERLTAVMDPGPVTKML
jgi:hypothetical protein